MKISKRAIFTCVAVLALSVPVSLFLTSSGPARTIRADKSIKSEWQSAKTPNFRYLLFVQAGNFAFSWHNVLSYRTIEGAISDITYSDHYRHEIVRCYLDKSLDRWDNEISLVRNKSKNETLCLGNLYPMKKSEWDLNS